MTLYRLSWLELCVYLLLCWNIYISKYINIFLNISYMFVTTVNEKEAMNVKRSKGTWEGLKGRKGQGIIAIISIEKKFIICYNLKKETIF